MENVNQVKGKAVTNGNSDVFHYLGLHDTDEPLAKPKLALAISNAITERGLTQVRAVRIIAWISPKFPKSSGGD